MNDLWISSDAALRLVVAAVLGALVGVEREASDQPAGLRTHLTVALGAAIFGVVSTLGFSEFEGDASDTNVRIDVTRVASQVVVGMGFLGAGIIFRSGTHIKNLTTAASLWVTAAIGLAAGVGDVGIALVGTVCLLVALLVLRLPRDLVRARLTRISLPVTIHLAAAADPDEVLRAIEAIDDLRIEQTGWSKVGGRTVLDLLVQAAPRERPDELLRPIALRDDVFELRADEPTSDGD